MSDAFAKALKNEFDNDTVETENGAVAYASSGSRLVDLNFAVSSLRNKDAAKIAKMFAAAYYEDREYALRWLFYLRDCRGGLGERRSFRICLGWLAGVDPETTARLVPEVASYGRCDDLFALFGTKAENAVLDHIDRELATDIAAMTAGKPVSLLAKWLPSANAPSAANREAAKKIRGYLGISEKRYRKMLSGLRAWSDVTEVKMSAGRWSEIDYEKVPSAANLRYRKAFLKNDEKRRAEYVENLSDGKAKINASVCFPSDIVYRYRPDELAGAEDPVLERMWKSLPDIGCRKNVLTVVDTSGSMTWSVCDPKSGIRPLDVAAALGVYCSEHSTGPFKDKCVSFSTRPEYIDFSGRTKLREKLEILMDRDEYGTTDVKAVMRLILKTAVDAGLEQKDFPVVLVLSDMEFDRGCGLSGGFDGGETALFEEIAREYAKFGYSLPKMMYWNLCSRTNGIPIRHNEQGVGLVSGYSQSTVRTLLSDKLDPLDILKEQLDADRYERISRLVSRPKT